MWQVFAIGSSLWFGLLLTSANEQKLYLILNFGYEMALNWNPLGAIFWVLYGVAWAVVRLPRFIVEAAKFIAAVAVLVVQFVARVFVYVHSSRRTLCFVDATLGSAIGYTFGSAIIGAVAGVILGVINYELVSVRWLRLMPQKTR